MTPLITHHWAVSVLEAAAMWQVMMTAMMAPATTPWMRAYARLLAPSGAPAPWWRAVPFAAGAFLVWLAYSLGAAALQVSMGSWGLLEADAARPPLGGLVLIAAGATQFLPVRQACLRHCRNPLTYLVAQWHNGPPNPVRLGVVHGAYCVGCCWLLMLTGFAVGLMNLAWMAVLTAVVLAEQTAPQGEWMGRAFGAALIAWGSLSLVL